MPWPDVAPHGYLGQLDPGFQAALAAERAHLVPADCDFYHAVDLPDGEHHPGVWDLRGREADYLGGHDVSGRRVLEIGPASGGLTFWMQDQGGEVVGVDAGYDVGVDLMPSPTLTDDRRIRRDHMHMMAGFQNAWWYVRRRLDSTAATVYGDVYGLPSDLGRFDTGVVTAVLMHLRRPIDALAEVAARVDDTIVVTEALHLPDTDPDANVWAFNPLGPGNDTETWVIWWAMTSGAVVHALDRVGFADATVTHHTQRHRPGHVAAGALVDQAMWTVVAHRTARPRPPGV